MDIVMNVTSIEENINRSGAMMTTDPRVKPCSVVLHRREVEDYLKRKSEAIFEIQKVPKLEQQDEEMKIPSEFVDIKQENISEYDVGLLDQCGTINQDPLAEHASTLQNTFVYPGLSFQNSVAYPKNVLENPVNHANSFQNSVIPPGNSFQNFVNFPTTSLQNPLIYHGTGIQNSVAYSETNFENCPVHSFQNRVILPENSFKNVVNFPTTSLQNSVVNSSETILQNSVSHTETTILQNHEIKQEPVEERTNHFESEFVSVKCEPNTDEAVQTSRVYEQKPNTDEAVQTSTVYEQKPNTDEAVQTSTVYEQKSLSGHSIIYHPAKDAVLNSNNTFAMVPISVLNSSSNNPTSSNIQTTLNNSIISIRIPISNTNDTTVNSKTVPVIPSTIKKIRNARIAPKRNTSGTQTEKKKYRKNKVKISKVQTKNKQGQKSTAAISKTSTIVNSDNVLVTPSISKNIRIAPNRNIIITSGIQTENKKSVENTVTISKVQTKNNESSQKKVTISKDKNLNNDLPISNTDITVNSTGLSKNEHITPESKNILSSCEIQPELTTENPKIVSNLKLKPSTSNSSVIQNNTAFIDCNQKSNIINSKIKNSPTSSKLVNQNIATSSKNIKSCNKFKKIEPNQNIPTQNKTVASSSFVFVNKGPNVLKGVSEMKQFIIHFELYPNKENKPNRIFNIPFNPTELTAPSWEPFENEAFEKTSNFATNENSFHCIYCSKYCNIGDSCVLKHFFTFHKLTFECLSCDIKTEDLRGHILSVHKIEFAFNISYHYFQVINKYLNALFFKCHYCGISSNDCQSFLGHMSKCHHICRICSENFENRSELLTHIDDHSTGKIYYFKCTSCDLKSTSFEFMNDHNETCDNSIISKELIMFPVVSTLLFSKCPYCPLSFLRNNILFDHLLDHNSLTCSTCEKIFVPSDMLGTNNSNCMTCNLKLNENSNIVTSFSLSRTSEHLNDAIEKSNETFYSEFSFHIREKKRTGYTDGLEYKINKLKNMTYKFNILDLENIKEIIRLQKCFNSTRKVSKNCCSNDTKFPNLLFELFQRYCHLTWNCETCKVNTQSVTIFYAHLLKEHKFEVNNYYLLTCLIGSIISLKTYRILKSDLRCLFCDTTFIRVLDLVNHVTNTHLICKYCCITSLDVQEYLEQHTSSSKHGYFLCEECKVKSHCKVFAKAHAAFFHTNANGELKNNTTYHPPSKPSQHKPLDLYFCPYCPNSFDEEINLVDHIYDHNDDCIVKKCNNCERQLIENPKVSRILCYMCHLDISALSAGSVVFTGSQ